MGRLMRTIIIYMASTAGICLYLMMIYGVASIIGQTVFCFPIPGLIEWTEILMSFTIFLSLPLVQYDQVHIRITIIRRHLSAMGNRILDLIALLFTFIFFGLLAWRTIIAAWESTVRFEYTDVIIKIFIFPGKLAVAAGCVSVAITIIFQLINETHQLLDHN